ncbi:pyridoxamine 5'-phosphate oxidase family protein [Actinomadura atramentaria]|uniref:pyridoxamine 5'-phosphate oxidase family protein n=1 Tax=Actinomadura atramentaria TaxID=1990 RepID=UPI00035D748F|nr:pyridoxamine 5'-phosphate oxidase family protein [Actinomadura atramentaria]
MTLDRGGLQILDDGACRALLAAVPIGRIVFTDRALPAVQPVNFTLVDGDVVVRTSSDSRLAAAVRDAVVAFEADDYDARTGTGWSVVVIGRARAVVDAAELAALRAVPLRPWVRGGPDRFLRIRPDLLSGRRLPGGP